MLKLKILSVPGYPTENSNVRITGYKRYNDFKALKKELVEYFKVYFLIYILFVSLPFLYTYYNKYILYIYKHITIYILYVTL